jgi:hypothetical protein
MYHRSANKISGAFSSAVSSVEHQVLSVRLLLASIAGRHHNIRSFRLQLIFLISLAANNMERYEDDPSSVADLGEAAFLDSQYVREQTKEADALAYILQYFSLQYFSLHHIRTVYCMHGLHAEVASNTFCSCFNGRV